jgi:hypothetical protein
LNVAWHPELGNAIYAYGSLAGMTVDQILDLAFNTDPANASDDLIDAVLYLGSEGEDDTLGECRLLPPYCPTRTPTNTPTKFCQIEMPISNTPVPIFGGRASHSVTMQRDLICKPFTLEQKLFQFQTNSECDILLICPTNCMNVSVFSAGRSIRRMLVI